MPTALGMILFSRKDGRETVLFSTFSCRRAAGGARGRGHSPRGKLLEGAEHNARPRRRCPPQGRPDLLPSRPAPRGGLGPLSAAPRPAPPPCSCTALAPPFRCGPAGSRPKPARCPPFSLSALRFPAFPPPVRCPQPLPLCACWQRLARRQMAPGPFLAAARSARTSVRGPAEAACGLPRPAGRDRVRREGPASAAMSALGAPLAAHLLQRGRRPAVTGQAARGSCISAGSPRPGLHLAPSRAPSDAAVLRDVSVPSAFLYFPSFNPGELGPVR